MKTIAPPVTIPARAPCQFVLLQKSAKSMVGPKAPPKPAQAKETIRKTELFGFQARITPMTAITKREALATFISFFSGRSTWKKLVRISFETDEDAASS